MQIESLKNLNITLLLDSNIDHNTIVNKTIFGVVSEDTDDVEHIIVEGPDFKFFQFPKFDYNLIIESKRLLVNDKSGKELSKSKIVSKIIKLHEVMGGEVKAYGFNFDFVANSKDFANNNLLSVNLASLSNVRDVGASLRFDKDGIDTGLDIKPIKDKKEEYLIHININHNESLSENESSLADALKSAEKIAREVISKI